jgi:hypothetical protein
MPPIGKDDAEMSYRRGYEHGAVETFRAVERFLDPATRKISASVDSRRRSRMAVQGNARRSADLAPEHAK